jgi:hypothetical protein
MSSDVTWFDKAVVSLVEEEFGEEKAPVVDCGVDAYFVDFLRDAPEATGKLLRCLKFSKRWRPRRDLTLEGLYICRASVPVQKTNPGKVCAQ